MLNNLISTSGKMGAGKDLLAQIIRYVNWKRVIIKEGVLFKDGFVNFEDWSGNISIKKHDYEIVKFADMLKDTVCLWLGCTRDQLEKRDFKNKELPKEWNKYSQNGTIYDRFSDLTDSISKIAIIPMTPRYMLQKLGTEGGRQAIHEEIWVNTTFNGFNSKKNWIITDCRFPNEADAVKQRGGIVLRIERPGMLEESKAQHLSETALDDYKNFDHVFINDGSVEDLVKKVEEWMH